MTFVADEHLGVTKEAAPEGAATVHSLHLLLLETWHCCKKPCLFKLRSSCSLLHIGTRDVGECSLEKQFEVSAMSF